MSSTFVYTPKGYFNLQTVDRAVFKKDGSYELISKDVVVDDDHRHFDNLITAVVPCSTEMECLILCEGDHEHPEDEVAVEPVLAWGLTVSGSLVPMTPSSMEGITDEPYALRKVGHPRVFTHDSIGGWANEKEWLASSSASKKRIIG